MTKFVKRPKDDISHNVYSENNKETLKIIRPLVNLQSAAFTVKEAILPMLQSQPLRNIHLSKTTNKLRGLSQMYLEMNFGSNSENFETSAKVGFTAF